MRDIKIPRLDELPSLWNPTLQDSLDSWMGVSPVEDRDDRGWNEGAPMGERSRKIGHVALVLLYWFALLGLIGEQGDP
jgi:hypothetical protein